VRATGLQNNACPSFHSDENDTKNDGVYTKLSELTVAMEQGSLLDER
jgi:hypothetical protein